MAGKKEKQRFIFFKYVPPQKGSKPLQDEEYRKPADNAADWFKPPDCEKPDLPDLPEYPVKPGEDEYPVMPDYPTEPDKEYPDMPDYPTKPGEGECPEIPEYPTKPDEGECPEEPAGPCPEDAIMHVIQPGDTFWKLAKKYGTTIEAIAAANPDVDPLNLQIGETLCIPPGIPDAKG